MIISVSTCAWQADVTQHTAVCRAYITTRRATEEKAELARALQEPLDGCDTCGFWRSNLESCNKCGKVSNNRLVGVVTGETAL